MPRLPIVPGDAAPARDTSPTPSAGRPDLRDEDIEGVLVAFYDAVAADALLAPYFARLDMREHIPRIADFWSTLIFHSARYTGNAFRPHLDMPGLTAEHFAHWLATLERTVDARHSGPNAGMMKALGHRIAYSMQLRLGIAPAFELREIP